MSDRLAREIMDAANNTVLQLSVKILTGWLKPTVPYIIVGNISVRWLKVLYQKIDYYMRI